MRTVPLVLLSILIATTDIQAGRKPIPEPTPLDIPVPKGAVHIVVNAGDKDLEKVFTFFPYPPMPIDARNRRLPLKRSGVYRIEVNPDGTVAAVTILKTSGRSMDFAAMKTFVRWKAKPGPLRVVDVTFTLVIGGSVVNYY